MMCFILLLLQGFSIHEDGVVIPMSKVIGEDLGIRCAALSGANLATEVAQEQFCESTIGCEDDQMGQLLKELFETPYFRVAVVSDRQTVEACGALKVKRTSITLTIYHLKQYPDNLSLKTVSSQSIN